MVSTHQDQRGMSAVEIILVIVIVAIVGGVGWFVYHTKQNSDKSLDQATSTSQNAGPHFAKPKADAKSKTTTTPSSSSKNSSSSSTSSPQ